MTKSTQTAPPQKDAGSPRTPKKVSEYIVEIVSDSGEGAQKAGQAFSAISAKMGNGSWTVEIIPAEIQPPARSPAGASGIRVRIGTEPVTNMGDQADLVVAFNEQVLFGRIQQHAYRPGTIVLLENKWAEDPDESIRESYGNAVADYKEQGYDVRELPLEKICLEITPNPRRGKNMFVLGMLCQICNRSVERALGEVAEIFKKKGLKVIESNHALLKRGYAYASEVLDFGYEIPARETDERLVVMNGNQATGLGIMASGMEMLAMYPITPATSVSHYLAEAFKEVGGVVHQAEDEIAAMGFAVGASYAGKTACTVTSGPGLALKMELLGLASMAEVPLVMVCVQRGGPSTGLPTKVEQGDLLSAMFGTPGDAPKIIMAPATIEECFHFVVTARKLAEAFRMPAIILTDANLATGVTPLKRPEIQEDWFSPAPDQSAWEENVPAYDWDPETGISPRPVPGQSGGEYVLTGLAHTRHAKVAYDPDVNQDSSTLRSKKLAALQKSLNPPEVYGDEEGDLLVVSWGSTRGAIIEGIDRAREEGHKVSNVHLRFLCPMEPGLKKIFSRFKKVMTIEINYSDDVPEGDQEMRRVAQLARLLRAKTLIDIDCWSNVKGQPLGPNLIHDEIVARMAAIEGGKA